MKKINERTDKVYKFIIDYIDNNGYPPSIREICAKLNIKSTATAYSYIDKLKQRGLLEKSPMKKRAITPATKKAVTSGRCPFLNSRVIKSPASRANETFNNAIILSPLYAKYQFSFQSPIISAYR